MGYNNRSFQMEDVVVQSFSHVWPFVTLWTTAHQDFLSFTISRSLLKLISIESVISSNSLILYHLLLLLPSVSTSIRVFSSELALSIRWPNSGPSTSVLPMNIQGWFPLGLTGLITLWSKGLSKVFSSTTVQKHQFFSTQPFLMNSHIHTWLLGKP